MEIKDYIDSNGYLEITKTAINKYGIETIIQSIKNAKINVPTKFVLYGDIRMILFKNLMEYRPEISREPVDYPNIQWLTNGYSTNKYLGKNLSFISSDLDYEKIDILSDFFTENSRLSAYRKDYKIAPLDYWRDYIDKLVNTVNDKYGEINSKNLREALWKTGSEAASFKLTLVSSILWQFDAKRILDISAGWGDRLLGAIGHYAERYLGFDPNPVLKQGHDEIIDTFTKDRTTSNEINKYEIRYQPFETADIGAELFDLVYSSPPYYDLEVYSFIDGQSIITYPEFEDWLVYFLFVSLFKAWNHLKNGGNLVLHITDFHKIHYVESIVLFVLGWCPNSSFDGVIGSIGHSGKPRPNWVFHKHSRSNSKEVSVAKQNMDKFYPKLSDRIKKMV